MAARKFDLLEGLISAAWTAITSFSFDCGMHPLLHRLMQGHGYCSIHKQ
jgi:hypothetical protein